MHLKTFLIIAFSGITYYTPAQSRADRIIADSLYCGDWEGVSLCQAKNSSCHDETVVYHISRMGEKNLIEIRAGKIIDGKPVDMGTLEFTYDPRTGRINSGTPESGFWNFKRKNSGVEGTLVVNNQLFRLVRLKKR